MARRRRRKRNIWHFPLLRAETHARAHSGEEEGSEDCADVALAGGVAVDGHQSVVGGSTFARVDLYKHASDCLPAIADDSPRATSSSRRSLAFRAIFRADVAAFVSVVVAFVASLIPGRFALAHMRSFD